MRSCLDSWDHVPIRSWPLFKARSVLRTPFSNDNRQLNSCQALHSQARTTHLIREEIRTSTLPQAELARLYNVTRQTIRKWQDRSSPADGFHCPKTTYTTLTPAIPPSRGPAWGVACAVMASPICATWSCKTVARRRSRKRSRTTSLASCILTSSTCRRCPTRLRDVICLSPSTGLPTGSTSKSIPIKPRAAVSIF